MYPGTILNYIDNSKINTENEILLDTRSPLWLVASTFPKGPEKLTVTDATNFYELYGDTMEFDKYGQLNLQAKNIIDNGGRLWVKRLMPAAATYGNLYYTAEVKSIFTVTITDPEDAGKTIEVECTRTISSGKGTEEDPYVYTYKSLKDGTTVTPKQGTEPVDNRKVIIEWTAISEKDITSYDGLKEKIKAAEKEDEDTGVVKRVPFSFIDNGRGGSIVKSVRFVPDYNLSRNLNTVFYNFEVYEGGTRKEYNTVTVDPSVFLDNKPYRLYKDDYLQIDTYAYEDQFDLLVDDIYNALNPDGQAEVISKKQIRSMDLLFGYTNRGEVSDLIKVSYAGGTTPFNATYGTSLAEGEDKWSHKDIETGETVEGFSNYVHDTADKIDPDDPNSEDIKSVYRYDPALIELMINFYHGDIDDLIYDVDAYRLFGVADANFPVRLKQAITEYVVFRNDCFFFRDLMIVEDDSYFNILSRDQLLKDEDTTVSGNSLPFYQTFMYADYCTTYEIIDPETRIRERVTMMYDLVSCLTRAYINAPFNPNAGTYNGYILESALPGSLNFIPLKTPRVNYKQSMEDAKINYATYEDNNNLVVQSLYTKNKIYSQLSYINNVLAMQEIGRRIAMACPAIRYSLQLSGDDVTEYAKIISGVLENYISSFDTLEFVYTGDTIHVQQKIFYGTIQFSFANWYQTEIFDLIANPTTILANTEE